MCNGQVPLELQHCAKPGQGIGAPLPISQFSPERQALLKAGAREREVSQEAGQPPDAIQRLCSIPGAFRRSWQRQCSLEPSTALTQIPVQIPEPGERTTQSQCALSFSLLYEPVQCHAQIVMFSLE